MKLFLKGERCFKPSCGIEKRNFAPGQHGRDRRAKIVGYGLQLREKQKVKRSSAPISRRLSVRKALPAKISSHSSNAGWTTFWYAWDLQHPTRKHGSLCGTGMFW